MSIDLFLVHILDEAKFWEIFVGWRGVTFEAFGWGLEGGNPQDVAAGINLKIEILRGCSNSNNNIVLVILAISYSEGTIAVGGGLSAEELGAIDGCQNCKYNYHKYHWLTHLKSKLLHRIPIISLGERG